MPPRTVLVADADPALAAAVESALRRRGYHVVVAADGGRAADLLVRYHPDAVVAGVLLPGSSGFQLARAAKERSDGRVPVVLLSPLASAAHRDYALALGVAEFLTGPADPAEVADAVAAVCPPVAPERRAAFAAPRGSRM
jgi:two-component system OmpR family response regulator